MNFSEKINTIIARIWPYIIPVLTVVMFLFLVISSLLEEPDHKETTDQKPEVVYLDAETDASSLQEETVLSSEPEETICYPESDANAD